MVYLIPFSYWAWIPYSIDPNPGSFQFDHVLTCSNFKPLQVHGRLRYQNLPFLKGVTFSKPSFWISILVFGDVSTSKRFSPQFWSNDGGFSTTSGVKLGRDFLHPRCFKCLVALFSWSSSVLALFSSILRHTHKFRGHFKPVSFWLPLQLLKNVQKIGMATVYLSNLPRNSHLSWSTVQTES